MADERPLILREWPLVSPYLQAVNKLMTISALPLYKYQFTEVIEPIFAIQATIMGLNTTDLIDLWMKQYGVIVLNIDKIDIFATNAAWAFELAAVQGNPLYNVGVRCPCRQRDGFGQPYPVCPD